MAALVCETVPSAGCTCNSIYSLAEKERDKGVEVVKEIKKRADEWRNEVSIVSSSLSVDFSACV